MMARAPKGIQVLTLLVAGLLFLAACAEEPAKQPEPAAPAKPAGPVVPPEIEAAATGVLGAEAEALVWGDLAKNGEQHVVVINRLKVTPPGVPPGTLFTRLAVVGKVEGRWIEMLRCDEYIKNSRGYLGGQPLSPTAGWRLQYEQDDTNGLTLYFAPITQPRGGYIQTVGVRWNAKTKRYQSLDREYKSFLSESPSLGTVESQLKR